MHAAVAAGDLSWALGMQVHSQKGKLQLGTVMLASDNAELDSGPQAAVIHGCMPFPQDVHMVEAKDGGSGQ